MKIVIQNSIIIECSFDIYQTINLETECEKWGVGMRVFIKDCKSCGV